MVHADALRRAVLPGAQLPCLPRVPFQLLMKPGTNVPQVNEQATMPRGTIKLSDVTEVVAGEGLYFTLKTPARNYELKAETETDKTNWLGVLANKPEEPSQPAPVETVASPDVNKWQMWSAQETGQWIASLGFPQYSKNFVEARVIGSLLQSITPHQLNTVCGIQNEEHQWKVLGEVQNLVVDNLQFGTPMPDIGFM